MTEQEKVRRLATEVMGWEAWGEDTTYPSQLGIISYNSWDPLTSIDHAWMLVEKLLEPLAAVRFQEAGLWLQLTTPFMPGEPYFAGFTTMGISGWNGQPDHKGSGPTAAAAICEAALAVLDAGT